MACKEYLAVFKLNLNNWISNAADCYWVISEIIRVCITCQIYISCGVQSCLHIQHQVHDLTLGPVISCACGRDGNLTDNLLCAKVNPEYQRHIVCNNSVIL